MAITKPAKGIDPTAQFIEGAGDRASSNNAPAKGVIRGKKQIITVGFSPELLEKIDAAAAENSISRAAFISLACSRAVAS